MNHSSQRYFCLDHPRNEFSYSLRNKKCIANKYFYLKAIAHNRNRTSIKGDRSIIFPNWSTLSLKSMRQLVKEKQINKQKILLSSRRSAEKFRDEHQHPVFSVATTYGWGIWQPFSNRCLSSAWTHELISLTSSFWEVWCRPSPELRPRDPEMPEIEKIHDSKELR